MQENSRRRKLRTCWYRRYYISIMLFLGYFLLYSTRINLGVAIVYMTERKHASKHANGTGSTDREFDWDEKLQGYALASFFYGYVLTQLPGGYLSGVIGGDRVLAIGVLGSGLLSFVTPIAAAKSFVGLIVVRIACGLLQGLTLPAANSIWAQWAPPYERTALTGMAISGHFLSPVVVLPTCDLIGDHWGWEWMFYFYGIVSCVWGIVWSSTVFSTPAKDRFITESERKYIEESIESSFVVKPVHPWRKIFGSPAVWAIIVAHTCHNWAYYTVLLYGMKFFTETEGFRMHMASLLAGWCFGVLSIFLALFSAVADLLRRTETLSTKAVRKIFTASGFCIQATFMLLAALVYIKPLTVISVIFGVGFGGLTWSGFFANALDIAVPHAAVICGISNTFATLPGIISPYVTSTFIPDEKPAVSDWLWVWVICAIFHVSGALFYSLLARGEKQIWVFAEPE